MLSLASEVLKVDFWFSAHETAELAARVEEQGAAFYRRVAEHAADETVRNMAAFFAEQEEEHRDVFRGIASQFHGKTTEYCYAVDIRDMLLTSLREIEDIFASASAAALDESGKIGCLNLALRVEATSVVVYGRMLRTYDERYAAVLARILSEEEKHLQMVTIVLSKI